MSLEHGAHGEIPHQAVAVVEDMPCSMTMVVHSVVRQVLCELLQKELVAPILLVVIRKSSLQFCKILPGRLQAFQEECHVRVRAESPDDVDFAISSDLKSFRRTVLGKSTGQQSQVVEDQVQVLPDAEHVARIAQLLASSHRRLRLGRNQNRRRRAPARMLMSFICSDTSRMRSDQYIKASFWL